MPNKAWERASAPSGARGSMSKTLGGRSTARHGTDMPFLKYMALVAVAAAVSAALATVCLHVLLPDASSGLRRGVTLGAVLFSVAVVRQSRRAAAQRQRVCKPGGLAG